MYAPLKILIRKDLPRSQKELESWLNEVGIECRINYQESLFLIFEKYPILEQFMDMVGYPSSRLINEFIGENIFDSETPTSSYNFNVILEYILNMEIKDWWKRVGGRKINCRERGKIK